jgi:UDP-N-acetylglucosamine acyltransferase
MVDRSGSAIHSTAVIHPGARLGETVEIGPYVVIEDDVVIGDRSSIGAHTVVKRHTRMGRENRVSEHVVIGGEPQDYKFDGSRSYVSIGDGNLIREGVTIHRGSTPEAHTSVGDNCFLMVASHVAHDCRIGNRVVLTNGALLAGFVNIADGAIISGNVVIHQFCRVGRLAFAGGGARVSQDCLPFMITEGSPARARALNAVGLRRAGFPPEEIASLKRALRVLRTSSGLEEALKALGDDASPSVTELVRFIRDSKRGFSHPTR